MARQTGTTTALLASGSHNLRIDGGRVVLEAASGKSKVRRFKLLAYTGGFADIPGLPLPVVFDLSTLHVTNGRPIPALLEHKNEQLVGHVEDLVIGPESVTGIAVTSAATPHRDTVIESAEDGFTWQLSVGVWADRENIEQIPSGKVLKINGQDLRGPFLLARDADLREITFTAAGADAAGAIATLAASLNGVVKMKFTDYLNSLGLKIESLTSAALNALRLQWKSTHPDALDDSVAAEDGKAADAPKAAAAEDKTTATSAPEVHHVTNTAPAAKPAQSGVAAGDASHAGSPGITQYERDTAAAVQRVEALTQLNASLSPEPIVVDGNSVPLLAHAISNGWTTDRFELECLRRNRPKAPSHRVTNRGTREVMLASLSGALMQHINVALDHRAFSAKPSKVVFQASNGAVLTHDVNHSARQQWMDQADKFRFHSLPELMEEAAMLDGIDLRAAGHYRSDGWLKAAFSSTAIQDMYTQALSARLMMKYVEEESALLELVTETDIPNFLAQERKRIEAGGSRLRKIINQGVAKDMTLSATGESYRASMFATRFQFSEMDMIDQRFEVLQDAGDEMGLGARQLIYDLIALVVMGNPAMANTRAFFNTTDGNRVGSRTLNRANLQTGITEFKTQRENGRTLGLRPTHLLVPEALDFTARELLSPTALITGSDQTRTSENTLAGRVGKVIADARLDVGFEDPTDVAEVAATIAANTTSWYLFDKRYPAIEVGYVQGHGRAPRIRRGELNNGEYGIWIDCSMAVGAAPLRRASARRFDA